MSIALSIYDSQDTELTEGSVSGWMDAENMEHVHMEYYSVFKKNEILSLAITWMSMARRASNEVK
jgi:hypothetical protein